MESHTEGPTATWSVPQCPFTIEYSSRALDDIRLAVVDAFFSLPRGGAEIGGVLLGSYRPGRLAIAHYLPLDCEHAFGPGFTLSPRDLTKLTELLASPEAQGASLRPVGWYHSHTRSDIFLSESDQEIQHRYFPEPWQVALVLKPHTFHPTRAGFFFREAGGVLHGERSYGEFVLEALAVRPLPAAGAMEQRPLVGRGERPDAPGEVITVASEAALEEPAAQPEPQPPPQPAPAIEIPPPRFLLSQQERSWRWLKVLLAVAAVVALGYLGFLGFQTRGVWLPRVEAAWHRAPAAAPASLGLTAVDENGQMQIRWNGHSPLVPNGANAILEIADGGPSPFAIKLDDAHLRSGSFTYLRQSERVDVTLAVDQANGRQAKEGTSFIGKLPAPPAVDPALVEERDDLARANAKLKSDLKAEVDRRKKLEKSLADVREQLRIQQQRRLENQFR